MYDRYLRLINYLRISVTDRCNLRCIYCMPEEGIKLMKHEAILSLEELAEVARFGAEKLGIRKVRLTGGEPLVRKGVINLVEQLNAIPQIQELAMTTNGILLESMAEDLKKAGLQRVNVSLDTLDPEKFHKLTRGGDVEAVKKGIMEARRVGLLPIKINMVRTPDTIESDLKGVKAFCEEHELQIRYIQQMDLESGSFSKVEGGEGGHCESCNRLRLMANGDIKPCLFNDLSYNVRELGIEEAYRQALTNKPLSGQKSSNNHFYSIGG